LVNNGRAETKTTRIIAKHRLEDPAFREKLSSLGATPVGGTPEEFGTILKIENAKWGKAIKDADIRVE
jgi:tripartite-type tricarboxylate transporter receptor subunit TctC